MKMLILFSLFYKETAMGHKRMGGNDDGFKYAMAVMKYVFVTIPKM